MCINEGKVIFCVVSDEWLGKKWKIWIEWYFGEILCMFEVDVYLYIGSCFMWLVIVYDVFVLMWWVEECGFFFVVIKLC